MDRIIKALDKVKRSPVTLDSYFKKYFELDFAELRKLKGDFHEVMTAHLAFQLRDMQGCINLETADPAFDELKSVIKSCVEKTKLKKKGRSNANTSGQGG